MHVQNILRGEKKGLSIFFELFQIKEISKGTVQMNLNAFLMVSPPPHSNIPCWLKQHERHKQFIFPPTIKLLLTF